MLSGRSNKLTGAKIVLITGGARSGKSRLALDLAQTHNPKVFVATCEPLDPEMRLRIRKHQEERDPFWTTVEEPIELTAIFEQHINGAMVIDCMTLWLSNLLMLKKTDKEITAMIADVCEAVRRRRGLTVMVSNEVGMGIVPDNEPGRRFRDHAGTMNQLLARIAHTVICAISGLPLYLKDSGYATSAH